MRECRITKPKKPAYRLLSVLICVTLLLCLAGCKKEAPKKIEITFIHGWGANEADHEAMRRIYSDFEIANPDIHLNMLSIPTNQDMLQLVGDKLTVGKTPDIIFTAGEGINSIYHFMLENDMLLDLMPYIDEDDEFASNISPIITEGWKTEQGNLFMVADVLILSGGYWYNKDIFKKAGVTKIPQTWEDFFNTCEMINEWANNSKNSVECIRPSTDAYLEIADNYLSENGLLSDDGNGIDISYNDWSKLLSLWQKINSYLSINNSNYSYRDEVELFNAGKLAIFFNGVWGASMIDETIDVGYELLPSYSASKISCQSVDLGYLLGNTHDKEKQEASVRFIKYMLSKDVQKRILIETQQMPSNPNIDIREFTDDVGRFAKSVEKVQMSEYQIDIPSNIWRPKQRETVDNYLNDYFEGSISEEDFINLISNVKVDENK